MSKAMTRLHAIWGALTSYNIYMITDKRVVSKLHSSFTPSVVEILERDIKTLNEAVRLQDAVDDMIEELDDVVSKAMEEHSHHED